MEELVGREVKKRFLGFGTFSGVITSYDPSSGYFKVQYEDGDSEEADSKEIAAILLGEEVGRVGLPVLKWDQRGMPGRRGRKRRRGTATMHGVSAAGREDGAVKENGGFFLKKSDDFGSVIDEMDICNGLAGDKRESSSFAGSVDSRMMELDGNVTLSVVDGLQPEGLDYGASPKAAAPSGARGDMERAELECAGAPSDTNGEAQLMDTDFGERLKENGYLEEGTDRQVDDLRTSDNQKKEVGFISPTVEEQGPKKRRRLSEKSKVNHDTPLRRSARRVASAALQSLLNDVVSLEKSCSANDTPSGKCSEIISDRCKPELPPSSKNLNLDGIVVLDVFSVYSCLRSFSTLLFLSPFSLEAFVESLKCNFANSLIDSIHFSILQALKVHLEYLSEEGSQSAAHCLRALNWELLDLITWPVYLVEYLLIHGSPMKPFFELAHLKLLEGEYYKQPAAVKLEILRCLCDDVLQAEFVRSELNRRMTETEPDADNEQVTILESKKMDPTMNGSQSSSPSPDDDDEEGCDGNSDDCCLCKMDGSLICCDGCPAAFHSKCVGMARDTLPKGDWYCPECLAGKADHPAKPPKLFYGAELLGIDIHERLYFGCWGYLLVSDSPDADSYCYYNKDDLNAIFEVLMMSSRTLYADIISSISKYWGISHVGHNIFDGKDLDCEFSSQFFSPSKHKGDTIFEKKPDNHNSVGPAEEALSSKTGDTVTQKKFKVSVNQDHAGSMQSEPSGYINYYSFGHIASSIGEKIMCRTSKGNSKDLKMSAEEIKSSQLNAISKKIKNSVGSVIQSLSHDTQKESCGWCFTCKSPEEQECLFNIIENKILEGSKDLVAGLHYIKNRISHIFSAVHHILFIEDSIHGFLSGPWENPHYREHWRTSVLKATDVASIKHMLLDLESSLRRVTLSSEWLKPADSDLSVGSASHILTSSLQTSSKKCGGRKRARKNISDSRINFVSRAASTSGIYWWRGGRVSCRIFNWKMLPRSLASKGGRQAGCQKIPGVVYPDASDFAKRSKYLVWRAGVEMSKSVAELFLHVKDLDSNIRWNDLKNTQIFSCSMKEFKKLSRPLRNVTIRRKCMEGQQVNYVLDFGRKKTIPEIVTKLALKHEETSSGRKKYWLNESIIPLGLLKAFELKKLEKRVNNNNVKKRALDDEGSKCKMTKQKRLRGFSYLFSKVQSSASRKCGQCKKDVPDREAVNCELCGGLFHKKHFKVPKGVIAAYMCYACEQKTILKVKVKKQKKRVKSRKSTPAAKPKPSPSSPRTRRGMILAMRSRKRVIRFKKTKKSQPSGKLKKDLRKITLCRGTRTTTHHSYWLNGLLWGRKPDDVRGIYFRSRKVLMPSMQSTDLPTNPECVLCHEEYSSDLIYLGCENCGDWFHGVAFAITLENIKNLSGFRCHKCCSKSTPMCPYIRNGPTGKVELLKESNAGSGTTSVVSLLEDDEPQSVGYDELSAHTNCDLLHTGDSVDMDMTGEASPDPNHCIAIGNFGENRSENHNRIANAGPETEGILLDDSKPLSPEYVEHESLRSGCELINNENSVHENGAVDAISNQNKSLKIANSAENGSDTHHGTLGSHELFEIQNSSHKHERRVKFQVAALDGKDNLLHNSVELHLQSTLPASQLMDAENGKV